MGATRRGLLRRGFSFAELLVVIAILGILSGLAVPKIRDMKRRAYVTTLVSDLRNLASTQEQYWTDEFTYSGDFATLRYTHSDYVIMAIVEATDHGWSATATHTDIAITCAVFFGSAAALGPASERGAIACT